MKWAGPACRKVLGWPLSEKLTKVPWIMFFWTKGPANNSLAHQTPEVYHLTPPLSGSPSISMGLTPYTPCCWPPLLAPWHPGNVSTANLGGYAFSVVCITFLANDHSKKWCYFISSPLPLAKLPNLNLPPWFLLWVSMNSCSSIDY